MNAEWYAASKSPSRWKFLLINKSNVGPLMGWYTADNKGTKKMREEKVGN